MAHCWFYVLSIGTKIQYGVHNAAKFGFSRQNHFWILLARTESDKIQLWLHGYIYWLMDFSWNKTKRMLRIVLKKTRLSCNLTDFVSLMLYYCYSDYLLCSIRYCYQIRSWHDPSDISNMNIKMCTIRNVQFWDESMNPMVKTGTNQLFVLFKNILVLNT